MKKNLKKSNRDFININTKQNIKEKKKFQPVKNLLKIKQIPLAGRHAILSALNNKNRKLHYLITTNENFPKWEEQIHKLKLKLNIIIKSKEEIDKINNYKPHQNVILVTEPLQRLTIDEFLSDERYRNKNPIR